MRLSAQRQAEPWRESLLRIDGTSNLLKNWLTCFVLIFPIDTHSEFTVYTQACSLAARFLQCLGRQSERFRGKCGAVRAFLVVDSSCQIAGFTRGHSTMVIHHKEAVL